MLQPKRPLGCLALIGIGLLALVALAALMPDTPRGATPEEMRKPASYGWPVGEAE